MRETPMTRMELGKFKAVLEKHDKWHRDIGDVVFPDAPDVTVDLSDAYSDSTLYVETCESLAIIDAELAKPEAREWSVKAKRSRLKFKTRKQADGVLMLERNAGVCVQLESRVKGTPAGPWEPAEDRTPATDSTPPETTSDTA